MNTHNLLMVFTAAMVFVPLVASAGGGYEQARIYSRSPNSLHVEGFVNKDNKVKDFNMANKKMEVGYGKKIKYIKIKDITTNQCFLDAPSQQPNAVRFGHVNYPEPLMVTTRSWRG
ncbi:MAG: hypothetical protein M5R38_17075 [Candidatus Methylomirabilis sp.]|nr:hypothetical protein [Candidatus Methylomirabilis sp.]